MGRKLFLYQHDELLGTLTVTDADFPWHICSFEPTSLFEDFRPFFDNWHQIDPDDLDQQNKWLDEFVKMEMVLFDDSMKKELDFFILHIDGEKAWFRD